eukprot:jgi/Mesvir1/22157/Mv18759-RA.1
MAYCTKITNKSQDYLGAASRPTEFPSLCGDPEMEAILSSSTNQVGTEQYYLPFDDANDMSLGLSTRVKPGLFQQGTGFQDMNRQFDEAFEFAQPVDNATVTLAQLEQNQIAVGLVSDPTSWEIAEGINFLRPKYLIPAAPDAFAINVSTKGVYSNASSCSGGSCLAPNSSNPALTNGRTFGSDLFEQPVFGNEPGVFSMPVASSGSLGMVGESTAKTSAGMTGIPGQSQVGTLEFVEVDDAIKSASRNLLPVKKRKKDLCELILKNMVTAGVDVCTVPNTGDKLYVKKTKKGKPPTKAEMRDRLLRYHGGDTEAAMKCWEAIASPDAEEERATLRRKAKKAVQVDSEEEGADAPESDDES